MSLYDITVIIKDKAELPRIAALIDGQGGTVSSQREIGARQFAYPVRKQTAGHYASFVVEIEPPKMVALQSAMNLSEDILRALVIHYQPVKSLAPEVVKEAPVMPEVHQEAPKIVTPKPLEPVIPAVKKAPVKRALKPIKKAKPDLSDKQRLKALDEQLKKLLQE